VSNPGDKEKAMEEVNANDLTQLRERHQVVDGRREGIREVVALLIEANGTLEQLLDEEQGDLDIMREGAENDEERERAQEIINALEQAAESCGTAITACEDALMTET
jgi:hypothetical protein